MGMGYGRAGDAIHAKAVSGPRVVEMACGTCLYQRGKSERFERQKNVYLDDHVHGDGGAHVGFPIQINVGSNNHFFVWENGRKEVGQLK